MRLQKFIAGTDKQIAWAEDLRAKFAQLLVDNNFADEDILLVLDIRVIAVWWIDNRRKLTLTNAPAIIRACKAARTRAGSIQGAQQSQLDALNAKNARALERQREEEEDFTRSQEDSYLDEVFEDRVRPW